VSEPFRILSINISQTKGVQKQPVDRAVLRPEHGIVGDAHAGPWHRQVSLLADEDIELMRERGLVVGPGAFAENLTTSGVPLATLPVGTRLYLGEAVLEVTQIGKECHTRCAIYEQTGDCVMPRRGVFARVIQGGEITRDSRCRYGL
jgi:MOSC domain-containing protein YiiM